MNVAVGNKGIEGFHILPIHKIHSSSDSLRLNTDEEYIAELAESIEAKGHLQPILVRPLPSGDFQIVAGEQRYLATKRLGLLTIPCIVKIMDDFEAFEASLIENLHRKNLMNYEIAIALQRFLEKFPDMYPTHQALATKIGKSRTWVTNHLRMLDLEISQEIVEQLTERQSRAILSASPEQLKVILEEIMKTGVIPSAREIMLKTAEAEEDLVQSQGILFEAQKKWYYPAQKYVPENVIASISSTSVKGTDQYKLGFLKYALESAWHYVETNGLTKRVLEEAENPLICKICKKRFFDMKVFTTHKCASMVSRETLL